MAFVLLLALTGSIGVDAAQDSTTIALTIEASPPWIEQVPQDVVPDMTPGQLLGDGERMVLVLADTFDDAAQLRLDSVEELGAAPASIGTLDQGRGGALAYWLDVANVDGQPWGAFTLVRSDASGAQVFTMFFGPVDGFAVGMASAQDAVTVNGGPIFDGVGG